MKNLFGVLFILISTVHAHDMEINAYIGKAPANLSVRLYLLKDKAVNLDTSTLNMIPKCMSFRFLNEKDEDIARSKDKVNGFWSPVYKVSEVYTKDNLSEIGTKFMPKQALTLSAPMSNILLKAQVDSKSLKKVVVRISYYSGGKHLFVERTAICE